MDPLKPDDPTELGGITLRGRLGRGGMGIVFYGITPEGEPVAVKTVRAEVLERSGALGRFDRETIAMGMVQSPRVANLITTSGPDDTPPWFALEYVRGLNLAEYITEYGPLSADLGAALGIAVAEALAEIHAAGIRHRDLKPANILLGADGPRVIDFGLAALTEAPSDLTHTGDRIGTPKCMAPEQANSPKDLPPATDVYALGAVLVYALAAHYPYERATLQALLFAITDAATPPDLSGVPPALIAPVTGMLAHAAAARPTLEEVAAELAEVLRPADVAGALRRLAEVTYRERETDPPPADPPRQRPVRLPEIPEVPSALVARIAEDLRRDYRRDARF